MSSTRPEGDGHGHVGAPVLEPGHTLGSVTDKISSLVLARPYNYRWITGFAVGFVLLNLLLIAIANLLYYALILFGVHRDD